MNEDGAQERRVEVTDEQLLDVWLTAGVSAVATTLLRGGQPAAIAETLARSEMIRTRNVLRVDPLAREELLERIHAHLRGEDPQARVVRAGDCR